ncbi:MAG TPA: alpha/beta fold hydrolase, partial [Alphaproteobacteria bacterium]|nr:alpha/beta fold hydrolase [Alphaproteobacteria bacterium]
MRPIQPLAVLAPELAAANPDALRGAAEREVKQRLDLLLAGIERYRDHPYRRPSADMPVLWREGGTRLYDYRPEGGRPVLFVPSLINRGYVLDLTAERSLLRFLARRGLRPLLLEWGEPGPVERTFTLTDYVAGRLERALDAAIRAVPAPLPVVGYCMGGVLVTALAQRRPRDVRAIGLLATPWDFHADGAGQGRRLAAAMAPILPLVAAWGELPVDAIQMLFAGLDPLQVVRKFVGFAAMPEGTAKATAFVALEDWLNDGVPLAASVAAECLAGWYGNNTPARGAWRI